LSQGVNADPSCLSGEIKLYPGTPPDNVRLADGAVLVISQNPALFEVLGTTYGGHGLQTFALPDLRGAEPKGRGSAGVNYYICVSGVFP
jgi:microcystin-dependent protein